ncbi:hypothetical protein B566_EDAN009847, partial [Ephemera danica]
MRTKVHHTAGNQSTAAIQGTESNTNTKPSNRSVKRAGAESTKSSLALKKAAMASTSGISEVPPLKVDIRFDPSKQQKETLAKDTVKQESKKHGIMLQKRDSEKCTTAPAMQNNDVMPSTSTRDVYVSPTTQDSDSPFDMETAFNHLYPSTQEEGLVYWDWRGQVDEV